MAGGRNIKTKNNNVAGKAGPGRPKGSPNKTTVAMKDAITAVYADLQAETGKENGHFLEWAKESPTEFYKIASKLLPMQVDANLSGLIGMPDIKLNRRDD